MKTKIMKLEMEMMSHFNFQPLARSAHLGKQRERARPRENAQL